MRLLHCFSIKPLYSGFLASLLLQKMESAIQGIKDNFNREEEKEIKRIQDLVKKETQAKL